MPCFLFTYHAHGSWLPDHPRGYVRRGLGVQPTDHRMAAIYGENLKTRVVVFEEPAQQTMIDAVREACTCQQCRCHFIATESSHLHALVSWSSDRSWQTVRKQLRYNATRELNSVITRQDWFSKSPSRKQVKTADHYNYLIATYLPRHSGLKWSETHGLFR